MPRLVLGIVAAAISFVAAPREAAAARVPVIYQSGQHAFECGPLPAPYDKEPMAARIQAGYLCDVTGIFWSYFSVRNCKPVAFDGDTYSDDPELVAAIKAAYPESSMKRGLWDRYGWILLALFVAAGLFLWIKGAITGKDDD